MTTRRLLIIIALLPVLALGALLSALAQDDGGLGPIAPASTFTPTPTAMPTLSPTPDTESLPTITPTALATATDEATVAPTALPTGTPPPLVAPLADPTPAPPRAVVAFNSVFIRELPAPDAIAVASAFRDDQLVVVGRNADGTWLEVRRPFRDNTLGWISTEVIDYEVLPEVLPLTDNVTRVDGPVPISPGTAYAVYVNEGAALRDLPNTQQGARLLNIPAGVTVPANARYRDGAWVRVNYLGTEGWIIGFVTRERDDVLSLPEIRGIVPGDNSPEVSAVIVPPEVQLDKLVEVEDFARDRLRVAVDLENFWWLVAQGDVLPCNPPATVDAYRYGGEDLRVLPEIDRYAPRMNEGIDYLNTSIDVLDDCGVLDPRDVSRARTQAINARIILDNALVQLDNLREVIR